MLRPVRQFINELSGCEKLAQSVDLLHQVSLELGFEYQAYQLDINILDIPADEQGSALATRLGWPQSSIARWKNERQSAYNPLAQLCRVKARSFVWRSSALALLRGAQNESNEERILRKFLQSEAVSGGVTVPIHRPMGKVAYVTWFTCGDGLAAMQQFDVNESDFLLMAYYFIDKLVQLSGQSKNTLLTPRERECLAWAAMGKTENEIGIILERSTETARFHLRNAIRKLKANNRTHAVAKACQLGLIGNTLEF